MREFLKGLELDKETIDTIMAEHGKLVTEDKEKIRELESSSKEKEDKITKNMTKEEKEKYISEKISRRQASLKKAFDERLKNIEELKGK
jgi:predicted Holliday junction resolvase-like endonuclease